MEAKPAYSYPNIPPSAPDYPPHQQQYPPQQQPYPPYSQQYPPQQQNVPPATAGNIEGNGPQSMALLPAVFIFITGGMSMAWSIGFNMYTMVSPTLYMGMCWFVAAIIGIAFGASLTNILRKKIFMIISALLVTVGGIVIMAQDYSYSAIIAARHLNGFAVGFLLVPTLIMSGQVSDKKIRGMVASSTDALNFSAGAFIQAIYSSFWGDLQSSSFSANQLHGLLVIICGCLALVTAFFVAIESPVYLLQHNQEQEALESLRRLHKPSVLTQENYRQLEEHKLYVAESRERSYREYTIESLPALFKLCICRCLLAMGFSTIPTYALLIAAIVSQRAFWPFTVYAVCRFIGTFIGMHTVDCVGRKKLLVLSMLICGGMAIGLTVIFSDVFIRISQMTTVLVLLFVFQFFAGMSVSSSSAYLAEAFPLTVEPFCMGITLVLEMAVQMIIMSITTINYSFYSYFLTLAILSLVFVPFVILCLPETKKVTLREAQAKFRTFLSTGFN